MSDDTLDEILATALVLAVFTLLLVIGLWSAEAYADRMATPTTAEEVARHE